MRRLCRPWLRGPGCVTGDAGARASLSVDGRHRRLRLKAPLHVGIGCLDQRRESRGGHFRDDYPDKSAEFGTFNIMVRKERDGSMSVARVPIAPMRGELKQIIEEMK